MTREQLWAWVRVMQGAERTTKRAVLAARAEHRAIRRLTKAIERVRGE
jgi:hypothetical protein